MKFVIVAVILHLILNSCYGQNTQEEISWPRHLAPNPRFHIYWNPEKQGENLITFELQVQTKGYVALGFSPNGGMAGSDIVIGWIENGVAFLSDRFATSNAEPEVDSSQDYKLLSGYENETHTVLRFQRKLDTCDPKDFAITNNTVRLIYAYHEKDPAFGRVASYHGTNRGTISALLLENVEQNFDVPKETIVWEPHMSNVTLPNKETTYWCNYFKLPDLPKEHHLIGYEMLVQPGHELHVHHLALYRCERNVNISIINYYIEKGGRECFSGSELDLYCYNPLLVWAVGSKGDMLPPHIGIPVAHQNSDKPTYMSIEMHYNNPEKIKGIVDSSGLRIFISPKQRQYSAGILQLSNVWDFKLAIPPKQPAFTAVNHCPSECMTKYIPKEGINFFMIGLHTHLAGRKLRLRRFRNGQELAPISVDENYDFNYQQTHAISPEIKIFPEDTFIGECVYSTMDRTEATLGGLGTKEEMCYFYVYYYPLVNLSMCLTWVPEKKMLDLFGVEELSKDQKRIALPTKYANTSIDEHIKKFDWNKIDEECKEDFQNYYYKDKQEGSCTDINGDTINFTIGYPNIKPYIPKPNILCPGSN